MRLSSSEGAPEFCEGKAADLVDRVEARQQAPVVALGPELQDAAPKEVELHGHLRAEAAVAAEGCDLVRCKDAQRIAPEVEHRDEPRSAEGLQALQRNLPLVSQVDVVPPARATQVSMRLSAPAASSLTCLPGNVLPGTVLPGNK